MNKSRAGVNVFFALWCAVLAIDGFRACTPPHAALASGLDEVLRRVGLWQGPWRLFGPDVDRQNLRLAATIQFADGAVATWQSPDWTTVSAAEKFYRSRRTNYFGNTLKAGQEPAWVGLCAFLARTTPHPAGATGVKVAAITLVLRGAIIPDPDDKQVPAEPYLQFDEPAPIFEWHPPA